MTKTEWERSAWGVFKEPGEEGDGVLPGSPDSLSILYQAVLDATAAGQAHNASHMPLASCLLWWKAMPVSRS